MTVGRLKIKIAQALGALQITLRIDATKKLKVFNNCNHLFQKAETHFLHVDLRKFRIFDED